jgi:hypothetical protein
VTVEFVLGAPVNCSELLSGSSIPVIPWSGGLPKLLSFFGPSQETPASLIIESLEASNRPCRWFMPAAFHKHSNYKNRSENVFTPARQPLGPATIQK